jgi:hypothetical protein
LIGEFVGPAAFERPGHVAAHRTPSVDIARVKLRDKTWGILELDATFGVDSSDFMRRYKRGLPAERLHKARNNTWYVVVYRAGRYDPEGRELTVHEAMDWVAANIGFRTSALRRLFPNSLDDLPDVSAGPTPAHGGEIIVKCLHCRRAERSLKACKNAKLKTILQVLQKASRPLSAAEIAAQGDIKTDSTLRAYLAAMVAFGHVAKVKGQGGYVLASKAMS